MLFPDISDIDILTVQDGDEIAETGQGNGVNGFRFCRAAVGEDGCLVFFSIFRNGGQANAVLGLHAADKDFFYVEVIQYGFQLRSPECIGMVFDDDRGIRCGFQHLGMNFNANRIPVKESARAG